MYGKIELTQSVVYEDSMASLQCDIGIIIRRAISSEYPVTVIEIDPAMEKDVVSTLNLTSSSSK